MGQRSDPNGQEFCPLSGKALLTKSQAKSTAKRQARRGGASVNLTAYKCRTCGGWHVGNRRTF